MSLGSVVRGAAIGSALMLGPATVLAQSADEDRRAVRVAAGVVAQGGTFGDDAPRGSDRQFGPTFSVGIRRHPTHRMGLAFETAFEPRPIRNPHFDETVTRLLLQIGLEIGRRVYVRPTAGGAVNFWSKSMDSGITLAPAVAIAAGYRHTTRGGVRLQPEFVFRGAAEIGAITWSAGAQIAVSLPHW